MGVYPQKKARFYTYICRNMTHLRQFTRSQLPAYQYACGNKTASGVCLQNIFDYSPFGAALDGRTMQRDGYRYGFNGQEHVREIQQEHHTSQYWEYNPLIVYRWNTDPKPNPSISRYAVIAGNPIWFNDPLGDTIRISYTDKKTGESGNYRYGSGDKLPKDKLLRQTVRTLDKIERRGADKFGIIGYLSKHETDIIITPKSRWNDRTMTLGGVSHFINWSPKSGYVSPDGSVLQAPALGLLHELGESYYNLADPEGKVAQYPLLYKLTTSDYNDNSSIEKRNADELLEKQETGAYDTWNDKWIIQNVESGFNDIFNDKNRDTHSGFETKVMFGPFSKYATKYYNHRTRKVYKIKNL